MAVELNCWTLSKFLNSKEIFPPATIICVLGLVIFLWNLITKRRAKRFLRSPPELRVRFYNPYGGLTYLPTTARMEELGLSAASCALDIVLGHGLLFQKEGIFQASLAYNHYVVLSKPEYAEQLLNSTVFLEKGKLYDMVHSWLGTGLLTSHGSKWKTRRKLLTHSFHFDILKDFLPVFDEQSKVLVDILKAKIHEESINIVPLIKLCSLDIICETTLGTHIGAQRNSSSDYVKAVTRASRIVSERATHLLYYFDVTFWLTPLGREFKKVLKRLHGFTRKVIQEKKNALKSKENMAQNSTVEQSKIEQCKRKRKALMDLLLDVHMNNPEFTEEDIREEINTFAFAGHDTTSMGMAWALYLIGLYPDVQSKIHDELDSIFGDDRERAVAVEDLKEVSYLERVLKESQRLYPSVPLYTRKATEDFHLSGYTIEKGSEICICPSLLHRNPDVFPNPEKFDPDRFLPENCAERHPFAYVPFSAGPRNCIGQRFAMMEEKAVITNILRRFNVKSLEQRDRIILTPELVLRSNNPLKVKFTPREFSP